MARIARSNQELANFEQEATQKLRRVVRGVRVIEEWPEVEVDAAILLYEVCQGLGLSHRQIRQALGLKVITYLTGRGILPDSQNGIQAAG